MTEEQRIALSAAFGEVHGQIHGLYPKGNSFSECDKQLRNQLLVVDLLVQLADEVIVSSTPDQQQIAERTANLLYAIRLIASDHHPFQQAAELLLGRSKIPAD